MYKKITIIFKKDLMTDTVKNNDYFLLMKLQR